MVEIKRTWTLDELFDSPPPKGQAKRLSIESGTYVPRSVRKQIKARRKQSARDRSRR